MTDIQTRRSRSRSDARFFLTVFVLGVVGIAALITLLLSRVSRPVRLPSDAELITNFHRHRADFERMRQLLASRQGDLRLHPDRPAPQPANAVEAELLTLMRKTGVRRGVETYSDDVVLMAAAEGDRIAHFRKGYTYRAVPPVNDDVKQKRLVSSLDERSDTSTQWTSYRSIGDGWYLFMIGGD